MKKLLILLAFFPAILLAQPNTVAVGTSANDGTGDPLRTAMQKLNANDVAAFDSIDNLRTDIEINANGVADADDSITIHRDEIDDIWNKIGRNQEADPTDITPPRILNGYAVNGNTINITASEDLITVNDSVEDAFTLLSNALSLTLDSVHQENQEFTLYVDDVTTGDIIYLNYDATYFSGIKDSSDNAMESFTLLPITNDLQLGTEALLFYDFEGDATDQVNNYDGVATSMQYESILGVPSGTLYARMPSSGWTLYLPTSFEGDSMPDVFSFVCYIHTTSTGLGEQRVFENINGKSETDGLGIFLDTQNDHVEFRGEIGGSNNEARMGSGGSPTTFDFASAGWTQCIFCFDNTLGRARLYLNGAYITLADSTMNSGLDLSGPWQIGRQVYGSMDAIQIYDKWVDNEEALWLYNNPGKTLSGEAATPPTDDFDLYANEIFSIDWTSVSTGQYTTSDVEDDFPGTPIGYINLPTANGKYPEVYDMSATSNGAASRVFRSWHYTGEPSGGTYQGVRWETPLNQPVNEVWVSYNMYLDPSAVWVNTSGENKTIGIETAGKSGFNDTDGAISPVPSNIPYYYGDRAAVGNLIKSPNESSYPGQLYNRFASYYWWYANPSSSGYSYAGYIYRDPDTNEYLDLEPGVWYNITFRANLGTVYGGDGFVEIYINGKLAFQSPNSTWKTQDFGWDRFEFKSYATFGSGDGPPADQYIVYDDLYIYTLKPTAPGYTSGRSPIGRLINPPAWDFDTESKINR